MGKGHKLKMMWINYIQYIPLIRSQQNWLMSSLVVEIQGCRRAMGEKCKNDWRKFNKANYGKQ
jgi:hypothetical protein